MEDEGGECFLAIKDREDSATGSLQRMYLAESNERLATQTKKKAKKSAHRRSQESKNRTTKSSKVQSTY